MFLANYLIGYIEDNVSFFSMPRLIEKIKGCTDYIGFPSGSCQNSISYFQPLVSTPIYLLAKNFDPVFIYNIVLLLGFTLNFFFSYRFYRRVFGNFIAFLLTCIFLFSPYFAYQSRSHVELIQFWPVIWFIDTLFFSKRKYKEISLGLLLSLITGVSYYLGYFTILFCVLYISLIFLHSAERKNLVKSNLKPVFKGTVVFILTSVIFLGPYIKSNFLVGRTNVQSSLNSKVLSRSFEDFMIFSSRPWYYVLPSVDNPFFGKASQRALDLLSSSRNYLTLSYFKSEHSASYIGWLNSFLAVLGVIFILSNKQEKKTQPSYFALLISIFILILLTMPPIVILSGVKFYTPSYILFSLFPMFRVLARAGIIILFLNLIFTGFGYVKLIRILSSRMSNQRAIKLLLLPLALFSFLEFFVPLKISYVGLPPSVYAYIGSFSTQNKFPLVVYPYSKTSEAEFWIKTYRQPLVNPRSYEYKSTGFISEDFTKSLNTFSGLDKSQKIGAKYLVYFYESDNGESKEFFNSSQKLIYVKEFKEIKPSGRNNSRFIDIVETGPVQSNSAILYEFR